MLDWMKKLLKKEESVTESPQTDNSPVIDKNEPLQKKIEARVTYQYPKGKFRFPLELNEQLERREAVQTDAVEGQPSIEKNRRKSRPRSLQWEQRDQLPSFVPQHVQESTQQQPEEQVFVRSQLPEVNRAPFRPTEVPSPVFGYTRPGKVEEKRPSVEDIVLSNEKKSVVDAWLEKNGYVSADKETEAVHIQKAYGDTEEQTLLSKEHVEEAFEKPETVQVMSAEESGLSSKAEKEVRQEPQLVVENDVRTELQTAGKPDPDLKAVAPEGEQQEQESFEEIEPAGARELLEEVIEPQRSAASEETEAGELLKKEEVMEPQRSVASQETEAAEAGELLEEEKVIEPQEHRSSEEPERAAEVRELLKEEEAIEQQEKEFSEEAAEAREPLKKETSKVVEAVKEKEPIENSQPVKTEEREKKRFVPYNVVMLKQDKLSLEQKKQEAPAYTLPPIHLLHVPPRLEGNDDGWLQEQKELLDTTFFNFNVGAKVVNLTQGPSVTRFEVQPEPGVKVNKITNLSDDIKLNLAARDIRIEAPIPGKNAVGIEVPNKQSKPVFLREILRSPQFAKNDSPLTVALGLDISGAPIVTDIRKMPHGLIAGSTGSGKSVCINAILTSILYKAMPHEVKLLLIDPKMVELAPYNEVPHLVSPVITDAKAATAALKWAVEEMDRRYESFVHAGARDLTRYNDLVKQKQVPGQQLPYIVIVIDELADLMMVAAADVEEAICRIAQKARACGIHLLVATQRPSVDVITGLIKSNIPTRIAFTVSSQVDSRTIIDTGGAEKLLGRGDMLFLENGTSKTVRLQGVYVSDEEIERTVQHVKGQMKPSYLFQQDDLLTKTEQHEAEDELFYEACQFVLEQGGASASSVQRRFRIGYNRAARLIEQMEAQGIISEARGTKPRDVLITEGELAAMQDMNE